MSPVRAAPSSWAVRTEGGRSRPTEPLQECPLWPSGVDRGIFQGSCNDLVIIAPHWLGPRGVGGLEALVWTLNLLSEILDSVPGCGTCWSAAGHSILIWLCSLFLTTKAGGGYGMVRVLFGFEQKLFSRQCVGRCAPPYIPLLVCEMGVGTLILH